MTALPDNVKVPLIIPFSMLMLGNIFWLLFWFTLTSEGDIRTLWATGFWLAVIDIGIALTLTKYELLPLVKS